MALTLARSFGPFAFLAACSLLFSCSEDSKGDTQGNLEAGAGTGGASGSGGASTSSGGATGAGGYDPLLATECGTDAGSDDCRVCLAATCCDEYVSCMGDAACVTAFEEYQRCFKDPTTPDETDCFPTFFRALEGGDNTAIANCIIPGIGKCQVCGPPAPF